MRAYGINKNLFLQFYFAFMKFFVSSFCIFVVKIKKYLKSKQKKRDKNEDSSIFAIC